MPEENVFSIHSESQPSAIPGWNGFFCAESGALFSLVYTYQRSLLYRSRDHRTARLASKHVAVKLILSKHSAYFRSQTFEVVLPAASTSYSNTSQALFRRDNFWEGVR